MHVGIDYGSKLAGTTVLCWEQDGQLHYQQSEKKKDADQWLIQLIQELSPPEVFIDAPLSLPAAYHGKGEDFFYRDCDRELRAMSPMFLGGLTARAMKLRHLLSPQQIVFQETYPAELVRNLPDLKECYLKKKRPCELTFWTNSNNCSPTPSTPCPPIGTKQMPSSPGCPDGATSKTKPNKLEGQKRVSSSFEGTKMLPIGNKRLRMDNHCQFPPYQWAEQVAFMTIKRAKARFFKRTLSLYQCQENLPCL